MAADGVRTVVIVDAGIARDDDYPVYREGLERGLFCRNPDGSTFEGVVWPGPHGVPRLHRRRRLRRWWGEQFAFYADLGVAGYWHDMNEPVELRRVGRPDVPAGHAARPRRAPVGPPRRAQRLRPADVPGVLRGVARAAPRASGRSCSPAPAGRGSSATAGTGAGTSRPPGRRCAPRCTRRSGTGSAAWATTARTSAASPGGRHRSCSPDGSSSRRSCRSSAPTAPGTCRGASPGSGAPEVMDRLRTALQRRYRLLPLWYTLALEADADRCPLRAAPGVVGPDAARRRRRVPARRGRAGGAGARGGGDAAARPLPDGRVVPRRHRRAGRGGARPAGRPGRRPVVRARRAP